MTSSFFFSSSFSFSCMPLESESETETETEGNRGALSWPNYRVTRCWLKWPERRAFFDDIWIWLEPEGSSSSLFVLVRPSLQLDVGWRAASTQPLHHHGTTEPPEAPLQAQFAGTDNEGSSIMYSGALWNKYLNSILLICICYAS